MIRQKLLDSIQKMEWLTIIVATQKLYLMIYQVHVLIGVRRQAWVIHKLGNGWKMSVINN